MIVSHRLEDCADCATRARFKPVVLSFDDSKVRPSFRHTVSFKLNVNTSEIQKVLETIFLDLNSARDLWRILVVARLDCPNPPWYSATCVSQRLCSNGLHRGSLLNMSVPIAITSARLLKQSIRCASIPSY